MFGGGGGEGGEGVVWRERRAEGGGLGGCLFRERGGGGCFFLGAGGVGGRGVCSGEEGRGWDCLGDGECKKGRRVFVWGGKVFVSGGVFVWRGEGGRFFFRGVGEVKGNGMFFSGKMEFYLTRRRVF